MTILILEDDPLDIRKLQQAISIRDRSYQLLLWVSDAVDDGKIAPSQAARHSGGPEAATDWLREYAGVIPEKIRPTGAELTEFAAFFSTYLISSFDVIEKPGKRAEDYLGSFCKCPYCLRIVNAPHLQAKKLTSRDKQRANTLMLESLQVLAESQGIPITENVAEQIVLNTRTRRDCAYLCYGEWLIRRLSGDSDGPAILALWRLIAWDPRGGQRRGFELRIDDFTRAESRLLDFLRDSAMQS